MRQRNVSATTIASYRETFRLLFTFAQAWLGKLPSALALDDLDAPFISAFVADLETKRGASIGTRNLRLTAIRSFFRFVSFEEPACSVRQHSLASTGRGYKDPVLGGDKAFHFDRVLLAVAEVIPDLNS